MQLRTWSWVALMTVGCGRGAVTPPGNPGGPETELGEVRPEPLPADAKRWSAEDGFVVHEWGTFTSVVSRDGALLPGLHHEEEDLPAFVADRLASAQQGIEPVQKMETPVTYFYAPVETKVRAKVRFPNGVLTQWFPWVKAMSPSIYVSPDGRGVVDAWLSGNLSPSLPPACVARFHGPLKNGLLDWGEVTVEAPGVAHPLPGPIGDTTWGFARQVAANELTVVAPKTGEKQHERFLFYRGLGDFGLPLAPAFQGDGLVLDNREATHPLRGVFVMTVTPSGAGFTAVEAIAPGTRRTVTPPPPEQPLDAFVAALSDALEATLVAEGLYTDEARAMVHTWQRSYFRTPGTRVLYLLPPPLIDEVVPLELAPAPKRTLRTMVIRVEVLSPKETAELETWAQALATPESAQARLKWLGLGRFAEPKLSAILPGTTGEVRRAVESLLAEVKGQRRWAPLAVE